MDRLTVCHDPEFSLTASGNIVLNSFGGISINGKPLEGYISDALGFQPVEVDGYKIASFQGRFSISIIADVAEPEIMDTLSANLNFA